MPGPRDRADGQCVAQLISREKRLVSALSTAADPFKSGRWAESVGIRTGSSRSLVLAATVNIDSFAAPVANLATVSHEVTRHNVAMTLQFSADAHFRSTKNSSP